MSNDMVWHEVPRWDDHRLECDRHRAIVDFVHERVEEGPAAYAEEFAALRPIVKSVFDETDALTVLREETLLDLHSKGVMRHLAAPPISLDDMKTVIEVLVQEGDDLTPHEALVQVVLSALDPVRVPWLSESRKPTADETRAAIDWTTGVWASERIRTYRRMGPSRRQEIAVADMLAKAGFREVPRPGPINVLDALERGCFCREELVAGTKADVPVRLRDGRLLTIECKVSNSYVNSVKRLIRETGGKSAHWQSAFGQQAITAAVLAGVFKLRHLREAQSQHQITLFWEHDLVTLAEFVESSV